MNIFRFAGDCCHQVSIALLLYTLLWKGNAAGTNEQRSSMACVLPYKLVYRLTSRMSCSVSPCAFPAASTDSLPSNRRFPQVASTLSRGLLHTVSRPVHFLLQYLQFRP
jgi:hypothetical protein